MRRGVVGQGLFTEQLRHGSVRYGLAGLGRARRGLAGHGVLFLKKG
jgi:hypothetical protein